MNMDNKFVYMEPDTNCIPCARSRQRHWDLEAFLSDELPTHLILLPLALVAFVCWVGLHSAIWTCMESCFSVQWLTSLTFSDREHEVQGQKTENNEWNTKWHQGEHHYSIIFLSSAIRHAGGDICSFLWLKLIQVKWIKWTEWLEGREVNYVRTSAERRLLASGESRNI